MELTFAEAHRLFTYEPETGLLRRRTAHGALKIGDAVGYPKGNGHLRFRHSDTSYAVHRVAWLMTYGRWPAETLDHIDGQPTNNRISNLREATLSQNAMNARFCPRNTSGYRGVSHDKRGLWRFQISANRKRIRHGGFLTAEAAHNAYLEHAKVLHGSFAHHQQKRDTQGAKS